MRADLAKRSSKIEIEMGEIQQVTANPLAGATGHSRVALVDLDHSPPYDGREIVVTDLPHRKSNNKM